MPVSYKRPITIVGGGIAGLATGYFLQQQGLEVSILEKDSQVGGKVGSGHVNGYTIDGGANGVLNNAPATLALIEDLGLSTQLQQASEVAKNRYIFWDGVLHPLPLSPVSLFKTPLLLPSEKIRALSELLQRPGDHGRDESVYDFIKRHFGRGVAERFADIMVVGVTAGDAKQLSVAALFPRLKALEREHGSLLRGMIETQRSSEASRPRLSSFTGGTQVLIDALRDKLAANIRTEAQVTAVLDKSSDYDGCYRLQLAGAEPIQAQQLVLATPAFVTAHVLAGLVPAATALLNAIAYADVHVVALAYDRIDVPHLLKGFGFLTHRGEALRSLGVLFSSSIFPEQAPAGKVLLRVIAGGVPDPDFTTLSEAEMLAVVRRDLRISLGITAEPELVQYIPWKRGIPQYTLGHLDRLAQLEQLLQPFEGLHLTGNAYRGVAINDCIREAQTLAMRIVQQHKTT